jgi:hypothetical protein
MYSTSSYPFSKYFPSFHFLTHSKMHAFNYKLGLSADIPEAAVDHYTAIGAANLKSEVIIEISDPNNPKIDMHDGISIISLKLRFDGGRR